MLPRVDLPELILEVMAWHPGFAQAFTSVTSAPTRLSDLHVSIAALLSAHAMNVGLSPVTSATAALTVTGWPTSTSTTCGRRTMPARTRS